MSDFFDSEIVKESLDDIKELQDLVQTSIIDTAFAPITARAPPDPFCAILSNATDAKVLLPACIGAVDKAS